MRAPRGGVTLVELLVVLVLVSVLLALAHGAIVGAQRATRAQLALAGLAGSLRTGAFLLDDELRELATGSQSDLLVPGTDSITYRAMRALGVACQLGPTEVRVVAAGLRALRAPQAGRDSLLLFVEGDPLASTDDRWAALPIVAVTAAACPGGAAGVALTTVLDTAAIPLAQVPLPTPLRVFEVIQIRLYRSGADYWLGARSVSAGEIIQPVLGPLSSNGLTFTYFDSAGTATTVASDTRRISVTLRGVSDRLIRGAGGQGPLAPARDSLLLQLGLRN